MKFITKIALIGLLLFAGCEDPAKSKSNDVTRIENSIDNPRAFSGEDYAKIMQSRNQKALRARKEGR